MREHTSSRQRMLDIAIGILEAHGEAAVRVRQVADEAGVAIASLYHFFGNREGLVVAATIERYRRAHSGPIRELAVVIDGCETQAQLRSLLPPFLEQLFDHEGAQRRASRAVLLGTALQRPALTESFAEEMQRTNHLMAEFLRSAQTRGLIRSDVDAEAFAVWFQGMALGRVLLEIDPSHANGDNWNKLFIAATMNALF